MPNVIRLFRSKALSTPKGTYGQAFFNSYPIGYSVEQPDNNNLKGHSCVPEGSYELRKHTSQSKYPNETVSLHCPTLNIYAEQNLVPKGVDGRFDCLIHAANYPEELEGCIAFGSRYLGDRTTPVGVGDSRFTMDTLQKMWGDRDGLVMIIQWVNN